MTTTTPPGRYDGRVAFVTGAANGIGRATALRLHAEGASVVIADHEPAVAAEVAARGGDRMLAVPCDVTDRASVDAAMGEAIAAFGGLDLLVTAAGGTHAHPGPEELDDATWFELFDLNLVGTVRCIRAAHPHLIARGGGAIVLIGSVNGLAAFGEEPYSVAKGGLPILARNLATRWGPDRIRTNVIAPGTVRTRVWDAQPEQLDALRRLYPLGRVGEPDDIAAAVAFLGSDDASWITGVTLPVDGGVLAGPAQALRIPPTA